MVDYVQDQFESEYKSSIKILILASWIANRFKSNNSTFFLKRINTTKLMK